MEQITVEKALNKKNTIFIDTRTPAEHKIDSIPNSVNIPIFSNEERKEIGILYNKNKEEAFNLGLDYYSKKLPNLVKEIKKLDKKKTIIVYCWRGGMRSKAITQIVEMTEYETLQLKGGYKQYRAFIRTELENYDFKPKFVVLWGNTGVGKTKIIEKISGKIPAINLEGIAKHRSSLFGAVGLKPATQKEFETKLYFKLKELKKEKHVVVEGESRKIGDIIIPKKIYEKIQKGINIEITANMKTRRKIITKEYYKKENIEEIKKVITKLKTRLGKKQVEEMLKLLKEEKPEEITEILLTNYYDKLYDNTIKKIKYQHHIENNNIKKSVEEIEKILDKLK